MKEKIIVQFERQKTGELLDLEIPLNITANELLYALNTGLRLEIDLGNVAENYLISENPVTLLRGDTLLQSFGLHDGSKICFQR